MDLENYETLDIAYPLDSEDSESRKLQEIMGDHDIWGELIIEFWTVVGKSFCTRVILPK